MQMRFSTYRLLACMAVVVLAGLPGVAAADEWDSCVKLSDDLAVAGCSRAIDSREYTGRSLARVYARRGVRGKGRRQPRSGGLQRVDADRSDVSGCLPQPRQRLVPQGRLRPGHRG